MRIKAFCIRNIKELLRDPLSYIFCLGFPIIMVTIMTIVNNSIPKEAGIEIFKLKFLSPAIIIFGYAFVMLFTSILISKDRTSTFLTRLYAVSNEIYRFYFRLYYSFFNYSTLSKHNNFYIFRIYWNFYRIYI